MVLTRVFGQGGQQDVPAAFVSDGHRRLRNLFPRGQRLVRRMGVQALHTNAFGRALHGIFSLKTSPAGGDSTVSLFAGTRGDASTAPVITRLIGNTLTVLPYNGVSINGTTADFPWSWAELNNTSALACKRGIKSAAPLLHVTDSQVTAAGIAAPTAGPTVGVGAAGALTGTWNAFGYGFVTADGHESNTAFTYGNVALAAQKFRWSALQQSSNPRVTHWRLYRAKVGASNTAVFEMVDIPVTTALPYDDDTADSALGFKTGVLTNLLPPSDPEHVVVWDERAFVTMNDPAFGGPGWAYTYIDSNLIPQFEAFDADRRVLRIPPRGGQRAVCAVPWDGQGLTRLALMTDAAVYLATPGASDGEYAIDDLDLKHGVVGPGAVASGVVAGSSWLVWCDGQRVLASNGGPPEAISDDAVEAALKDIPPALAAQAVMTYRRAEGGFFSLSFASTSSSTTHDLELCWSPGEGWNEASYLDYDSDGVGLAPVVYGSAPSGTPTYVGSAPTAFEVATFNGDNRIFWLDSTSLRDAGVGTPRVFIEIDSAALRDPESAQALVVSQAVMLYQHRRDTLVTSSAVPGVTFSLSLDSDTPRARTTTPSTPSAHGGRLRARCHNLGDHARTVSLVIRGACEPAVEITYLGLDAAPMGARSVV